MAKRLGVLVDWTDSGGELQVEHAEKMYMLIIPLPMALMPILGLVGAVVRRLLYLGHFEMAGCIPYVVFSYYSLLSKRQWGILEIHSIDRGSGY